MWGRIPQMRAKQADSDPRLQCVFLRNSRAQWAKTHLSPRVTTKVTLGTPGVPPSGTFRI